MKRAGFISVLMLICAMLAPSSRLPAQAAGAASSKAQVPVCFQHTGSWTESTQGDFQSGQRWGVDTYSTPGSITLLPLSDSFDKEFLNQDRWKVTLSGSGILTQTQGQLLIANYIPGSHSVGIAAFTGDYLRGDVDAQVDFELVTWPSVRNAQAHLYLRDEVLRYVEIKRDGQSGLPGLSDGYAMCYGGSGWYNCPSVLNRSDLSGTLRVKRSGSEFTTYLLDGEDWYPLGTADHYDTATGAWLAGWNADTQPTFDIRFDDLLVTRNGGIDNPTYTFTGTYTSTAYDTGGAAYFVSVAWLPQEQPAKVGHESLKLQIATNKDNATWSFLGPDGTPNTYYAESGEEIWEGHGGDRYVRYRVFLSTPDPSFTPRLDEVTLYFVPSDAFYLTRLPFDADFTNHQDCITSYFDHNFPGEGTITPQPPDYDIRIYDGRLARQSLGTCCTNLPCYLTEEQLCIAYDGHNGYDYDLDAGAAIYPAAPGTITNISSEGLYPWRIDIEHAAPDGTYITWYAHISPTQKVYQEWLDSSPEPSERRLPVEDSTVIGTVKSGAGYGHLHFTVKREGHYTDPYGWLPPNPDPLQAYNGENSRWLWLPNEPQTCLYEPADGLALTTQAKDISINVPPGAYSDPMTMQLYLSALDPTPILGSTGHTFSLAAWDPLGNPIASLHEPLSITIRYAETAVANLFEETVALYHWDGAYGSWQGVPSQLDTVANIVRAQVAFLGRFTLLGTERYDVYLPVVVKE